MTVYRPKGSSVYAYDFWLRKQRYRGSTHQKNERDAEMAEAKIKLKARQMAGGIAIFDPEDTPRFADWAPFALRYQRDFIRRPDVLEKTLAVVLEFCGAPPETKKAMAVVPRSVSVKAPHHNLRLGHFIADANWLVRFEKWIEARRVSGSTRNSYLSAMSTLYRVALATPEHRILAQVPSNPFRDLRRSPRRGRFVALPAEDVIRWIQEAAYHVALAGTIAALAPKLRLNTILSLQWRRHFDRGLTRIRVDEHKTAGASGPQIVPVSQQLSAILTAERDRQACDYVVNYHGKPVGSIQRGARFAAERAGLTWGIRAVTFHTIRHSIATLLAELGQSEAIRKELMGHREIRTTQQYTHLAALSQVSPHEQLSSALPLEAVVLGKTPRAKAPRRIAGTTTGTRAGARWKFKGKAASDSTRR